MLKSTVVILAMFGSVSAQASPGKIIINAVQDQKAVGAATNPLYQGAIQDQKTVGGYYSDGGAVQDQKAVGGLVTGSWDAIQDQKAVGPMISNQAVQDNKAISLNSQVETAKLLDLNEGF